MNVLVFDIETIPDLDGGRRIYDLDGLSDKDTASALLNLRRQENGTEFLRLHLHRIVAISVVLRSAQGVKVWSLGDENSTEKELIERFYDIVETRPEGRDLWPAGRLYGHMHDGACSIVYAVH